MADGDKLILGTDFNEENTTTELTKSVGFLPVLDLFNSNGVGLLSIGGQSVFHGNVVSKGEAVAAFSPGVGVYATGDDGGVLAVGRVGVDAISEIGGVGVRGTATTGRGVVGSSAFGPGVEANSASGPGVLGTSGSGHGVNGLSRTRAGVVGTSINFIGTAGVAIERGIGVVGIGLQGAGGRVLGRCRCPWRLHRGRWRKIRRGKVARWFLPPPLCVRESGKLVRRLRLSQAEQREMPGETGAQLRIGDTGGFLPCLPHTQRRLERTFHQPPDKEWIRSQRAGRWRKQHRVQLSCCGKTERHCWQADGENQIARDAFNGNQSQEARTLTGSSQTTAAKSIPERLKPCTTLCYLA